MDSGLNRQVVLWNLHMLRKLREPPWNSIKRGGAKNLRNAIACVCMDSLNGLHFDQAIHRAITWLKNHTSLSSKNLTELFMSHPPELTGPALSIRVSDRGTSTFRVRYSNEYYFQISVPTPLAESIQQCYQGNAGIIALVERYSFIHTSPRFFWSISPETYKVLQNFPGDVIEAFASPFNHNLPTFCSLYPEDRAFESIGNFFDVIACPPDNRRRRWIINPPFTNTIFSRVHDAIVERMRMSPEDEYYFLMPEWPTSVLYRLIQTTGKMVKIQGGKYIIFDHLTAEYISPFVDMVIGTIGGEIDLELVLNTMMTY